MLLHMGSRLHFYTLRKINGWNLKIQPNWKRKSFSKSSFSGSLFIFQGDPHGQTMTTQVISRASSLNGDSQGSTRRKTRSANGFLPVTSWGHVTYFRCFNVSATLEMFLLNKTPKANVGGYIWADSLSVFQ